MNAVLPDPSGQSSELPWSLGETIADHIAKHKERILQTLTKVQNPWVNLQMHMDSKSRNLLALVKEQYVVFGTKKVFETLNADFRITVQHWLLLARIFFWYNTSMEYSKKYVWLQIRECMDFIDMENTAQIELRRIRNQHARITPSYLNSMEIDTSYLAKGDRECPICYQPYGLANDEGVIESAVQLECSGNHVVGRECMTQWLNTRASTCPLDRERLYSVGTPSPVRTRENAPDWINRLLGGVEMKELFDGNGQLVMCRFLELF